MKVHFSTAHDARAVVDPVLRAWEAEADLRGNRGALRFKFAMANIVDRSPCPPGVVRAVGIDPVTAGATVTATGEVVVHVNNASYPEPPSKSFRVNPDAQSILDRYFGYLDGREPLLSMAYFCLTTVENNAAKSDQRKRAADKYRIKLEILNKIGELTARRGDRLTARKASAMQPLTASESAWLEAAGEMIQQLGTLEAARSWVEMSDLPPL